MISECKEERIGKYELGKMLRSLKCYAKELGVFLEESKERINSLLKKYNY